jgi:hypothetical protein
MSLNGKAKDRSKIQRAIAGSLLIEEPEAAGENRLSEVPRREPPRNGHVSVHDWWGTKIVVNMKGPECSRDCSVFRGGS